MMPRLVRRVTASNPSSLDELRQLVPGGLRAMIKGVVDLRRRLLVIDADMHAEQEAAGGRRVGPT